MTLFNVPKAVKKKFEKIKARYEEIIDGLSLDLNLDHEFAKIEEQFLNKTFSYTDTADSFKIQKDSKGYFLTKYIDESAEEGKEVPVKEETVRLKLINGTFLVEDVSKDEGNLAYAYDTKLKKVVFINPYNKFKIMLIAN